MLDTHLLSWLIFLPLIGAVAVMLAPASRGAKSSETATSESGDGKRTLTFAFGITLLVSVAELALAALVWFRFEPGSRGFQLRETAEWIPGFQIWYDVGVDGMSVLLILLTAFLTLLCVIYSARISHRVREYMAFILILETAMMGVFSALDLVLFYVFWELVLIPMYFLIGVWGHERRIYAAVKFFIFTFVGSILMLVGIVFLYVHTGTFSLVALTASGGDAVVRLAGIPAQQLMIVYAAFALAFMVKVPMAPFHTWLPDAHVEAPTAGSVLLAGVLLKMGVYGFLRFCLPLFPEQMEQSAPLFLALAVIGIIYGAIVAAVQPDMKKLVAYSSISHMGVVMLGVFSFTALGVTGAILQSVNHGVTTAMLFFLVGMLYDRRHTREIAAYGGLRRAVPLLSAVFMIGAFASAALPLTNGFVGEFLVLQGAYLSPVSGPVYAALGACGMVLSAVYMLWLYQRAFSGPLASDHNRSMADLTLRERLVLAPLVVMIFWFGCYVAPWLRAIDQSPHKPVAVGHAIAGVAKAEPSSTANMRTPRPDQGRSGHGRI